MKVAIVGLSTRRPYAYGEALKARDIEITCVWDYNHHTADLFCREFGCVDVVDNIEQIADAGVDGVMICTKSGDHARYALPFIEGGVPTFIDAPMLTNQSDLERIVEAVCEHGTPIMTPDAGSESGSLESFEEDGYAQLVDEFLKMCDSGEPPIPISEIAENIRSLLTAGQ